MPLGFQSNAFQNNAFQMSYDPVEWGPFSVQAYRQIVVGPDMRIYARGTAILITMNLYDLSVIPPVLVNAQGTPTVTITNPDGTARVTNGATTQLATGQYEYVHQSQVTDQAGAYEIQATALSGAYTALTVPEVGFVLT